MKEQFSTIILAGGKSSRMGTDKGLLRIRDKSFVECVIDAANPYSSEIVIISNNKEYEQFGYPVFADIIPDKGPLGGIYTGLHHCSADKCIVLSCDIPYIDYRIIEELVKKATKQITIVSHNGVLHPLIGVYSKKLEKQIRIVLDNDQLKIREFIKSAPHKVIDFSNDDFHESVFYNINTKKEYKSYCYGN
ncbi:MAG: molybdenum cofactor guanylyltransferase [Flavobacteriales bacterium]|nr:molybdenum cofactor guanylyltransferase [Flavobacteriales bacterium]